MIFITLGSQKFQFNRMLENIDQLIEKKVIQEKVYAQIGYSSYKPIRYAYTQFLNRRDFKNKMEESDVVITHAGTGAIITALKSDKKVIAMPRQVQFGEHVDNHQDEISAVFKDNNYIFVANSLSELEIKLLEIRNHEFKPFQSNNENYIKYIGELYGK